MLELASAQAANSSSLVTAEAIAEAQQLPTKFLEGILRQLRMGGLVESHRGAEGGYRLARPATSISVADVMRVLDGPLAEVRGLKPEDTAYRGASENLRDVWVGVRASMRRVLERVTLADLLLGKLPRDVQRMLDDPDAWVRR